MCGIIHAKRRDKVPANKSLMKRFKRQKSRGTRGFGFVSIIDGKVVDVQRFETETAMEKAVEECKGTDILFHHRLPTSTPNLEDMAHPIEVDNKELDHIYYVIHNGVLQNEKSLKTKHEGLGYEYTTILQEIKITKTKRGKKEEVTEKFNDSEALAIEVARFLDGKDDAIDIIGTAAIIAVKVRREDRKVLSLHWGRNDGNPMIVENNNDLFFLKSEGEGDEVPENVMFSMDYETEEITERPVPIGRRTFHSQERGPRYDDGYDDDDYGRGASRIGFGMHGQRGPIRSPYQRVDLLSGGAEASWGDDEEEDMLAVIRYDDIDDDYESRYREYQRTPGYLDDLRDEIETIKQDIADCKSAIASGQVDKPGSKFTSTYLEEAEATLADKKIEEAALENYLFSSGTID